MKDVGRIIVILMISSCMAALDEVIRVNVRQAIKNKFFGGGDATEDTFTGSGCCGGGCL